MNRGINLSSPPVTSCLSNSPRYKHRYSMLFIDNTQRRLTSSGAKDSYTIKVKLESHSAYCEGKKHTKRLTKTVIMWLSTVIIGFDEE